MLYLCYLTGHQPDFRIPKRMSTESVKWHERFPSVSEQNDSKAQLQWVWDTLKHGNGRISMHWHHSLTTPGIHLTCVHLLEKSRLCNYWWSCMICMPPHIVQDESLTISDMVKTFVPKNRVDGNCLLAGLPGFSACDHKFVEPTVVQLPPLQRSTKWTCQTCALHFSTGLPYLALTTHWWDTASELDFKKNLWKDCKINVSRNECNGRKDVRKDRKKSSPLSCRAVLRIQNMKFEESWRLLLEDS